MQSNINSTSRRAAVTAKDAKERIKRRGWVCIQERLPQSRLAHLAYGQVLSLVPGITKACFPVPSLEIIAKFSYLTAEPGVKETIPVGELFTSLTRVVNCTKPNPCCHGDWHSVNIQSRIPDREGIKRIRDWHTDTRRAKAHVHAWDLEWIGYKRHSCERRIEIRADKFKVGKHLQVLVADVANE